MVQINNSLVEVTKRWRVKMPTFSHVKLEVIHNHISIFKHDRSARKQHSFVSNLQHSIHSTKSWLSCTYDCCLSSRFNEKLRLTWLSLHTITYINKHTLTEILIFTYAHIQVHKPDDQSYSNQKSKRNLRLVILIELAQLNCDQVSKQCVYLYCHLGVTFTGRLFEKGKERKRKQNSILNCSSPHVHCMETLWKRLTSHVTFCDFCDFWLTKPLFYLTSCQASQDGGNRKCTICMLSRQLDEKSAK